MERLIESVNGKLCIVGMNETNEVDKIFAVVQQLYDYQEIGKEPSELKAICGGQAEPDTSLQKAFALACRMISDFDCPDVVMGVDWPECKDCENKADWLCWQKYFQERVEKEPVCRVCGCTWNNACSPGCCWVEEDLCSSCADKEETGGEDID